MIIDCVADLHGHYPTLEGGDLLIVAGDLTATDRHEEYLDFDYWIGQQPYKKKVVIAGNHDNYITEYNEIFENRFTYDYLCDSGTDFFFDERYPPVNGGVSIDAETHACGRIKIWGSPWTLKFPGMNPRCMAFTCDTEEELAAKWALIPDDTDILVTHGPPHLFGDKTKAGDFVGSESLRDRLRIVRPLIHICGHIHEGYGKYRMWPNMNDFPIGTSIRVTDSYNCSHVNEQYEPVNAPVRLVL